MKAGLSCDTSFLLYYNLRYPVNFSSFGIEFSAFLAINGVYASSSNCCSDCLQMCFTESAGYP